VLDAKKAKRGASSAAAPAPDALSPSPVVNQLDESSRDTFISGRPLEDSLNLQQCKLCKKGVIRTAAKAHIDNCMKIKKEKAQRKKEAREARERAKEQAREQEARKADEDGDVKMNDDSDDDDDGSPEKKGTNSKAPKKVSGKKPDGEPKGKKRKADADADKGPKNKKKKEEPKPKVPKPKGITDILLSFYLSIYLSIYIYVCVATLIIGVLRWHSRVNHVSVT
jgi:SAGA-associated factor 73